MKSSIWLIAAALALSTALPAQAADSKIKVVATFSVLGDLASEIGGDHVEVRTLVGPNGDAHTFEPSPADAKAMGGAAVLVENGLGLEGWLGRLISVSGFKGEKVIATEGVKPIAWTGAEEEEGHDHDKPEAKAEAGHDHDGHDHAAHEGHSHSVDPHAWQNPLNGVLYVQNIVAGLSAADPDHAADYKAKGDALASALKAIDANLKTEFAKVPAERRKLVTSHDAFGYFADAYGIQFVAPEGVSTESEASAADVAKIIRQIKAEKITALFAENITDPRLLNQIARETGVTIGGELFSDALSPPDGPAPTYLKMFENNGAKLLAAMKGS
ncbi:metal ABC transporter substrate-binding protein [Kaistia nematophila]|uniref:Metal ABC transporter substrate-binding protein n=1 Tax=Kaistia nematophila TaxID=2994654 RepID=A0A9X3IMK1_9HYPH|nr:metal ABC transporter substrate-binding protein [Kaistia nematophila]MCX5571879.1 metal ABC transporter substrate-binding protein [Kaistia nematophila]